MNKLLGSIAAFAFALAVSAATAEDTTGKITAMDGDANKITLDNGMTFTIGEGVEIKDLKEGDEVSVTYEEEGEERTATDVKPAQPQ